MGWDEIEAINKKSKGIESKFNILVYDVFTTISGKQLLDLLIDQFLYNTVASPQDPASYGYFREGQNSLIRQFVNVIKKKQQQTPPITVTKPEEIEK